MLHRGGYRTRNQSNGRRQNASSRRALHEEPEALPNAGTNDIPIGWNSEIEHLECSKVNQFSEPPALRSSYCRQQKSHRSLATGKFKSLRNCPVTSHPPTVVYGAGLCRSEKIKVVLEAVQHTLSGESRRRGGVHFSNPFGFSLQPSSPQTRPDEPLTNFPLIVNVVPGGPAFQSGVIQSGDSLLAIQGDSPLGKTIDELTTRHLSPSTETGNRHLSMVTQYTVAENVIPSSGIFDVRILKCSASLGINLQISTKSRPGEPLLISKVIPGSVASRCGFISAGDILLAVNGVSLEARGITDAACLLQTSENIVTLRIQKPDEEAAASLSDKDVLSSYQSDLEIVGDDDDFDGGDLTAEKDAREDEYLSQSADESILCLQQPSRLPRRYRSQKTKKNQDRRLEPHQQLENEANSDKRGNPSDIMSSDKYKGNICNDTLFEVHKVRLTRSHSSCPWGVVISGTDDVIDAPIYIDSLTPGKPAAISGLLQAGDRILGLDGIAPKFAGGCGLTLSLITARLQQPLEHVTLYIAKEKAKSDLTRSARDSDAIVKQYSWGTSCSPATEVNHSVDEERVKLVPTSASAVTRAKKQNFSSKIPHSRNLPSNRVGNDPGSSYFKYCETKLQPTAYSKVQGIGRSMGDLPGVTRQTVDAYTSKGEPTPHSQHHHHRHSKKNQQHCQRRKTDLSKHQNHYRNKQNPDVENKVPRASSTLDLSNITCPGCREAVANEVLNYQRLIAGQCSDRSQSTCRRDYLRLRGRSLEVVDAGTTEAVDNDTAFSSHSTHRNRQHHHNLKGSAVGDANSSRNLSWSDSRLNRDRLEYEDEENEQESSDYSSTAALDAGVSVFSTLSSSTASRSIAFSASCSSRSSSICSTDILRVSEPLIGLQQKFAVIEPISNEKPRNYKSAELLPRGNPYPVESRNTPAATLRRHLNQSSSRQNHLSYWRGWIRLVKHNAGDSFGIGLSKGLSSRGIYVSAIRPGSIADTSGLLQISDRILKVNEVSTKGRTCREVAALIRQSTPVLDLFVYRQK